jgi:uncharacterized membrane protein
VDSIVEVLVNWTTRLIEVAGIVVIVIGAAHATVRFLADRHDRYRLYRSRLGRAILLGLEFLVAADIIATIAIEPSLKSVLVLAGIVLIRTFLSISLEVEIEGRWPWEPRKVHKSEAQQLD